MYTYVINKGKSYHVNKLDDGYEITYSLDGVLYSQVVNGEVNAPVKVGLYDERVKLFDGKYLNRVRGTLTISEE
ncbi:MAG: hypothetical protein IJA97_01425 [Clostridia bacterium]|nr:hypothetical protein [Clostridia bacterium]